MWNRFHQKYLTSAYLSTDSLSINYFDKGTTADGIDEQHSPTHCFSPTSSQESELELPNQKVHPVIILIPTNEHCFYTLCPHVIYQAKCWTCVHKLETLTYSCTNPDHLKAWRPNSIPSSTNFVQSYPQQKD